MEVDQLKDWLARSYLFTVRDGDSLQGSFQIRITRTKILFGLGTLLILVMGGIALFFYLFSSHTIYGGKINETNIKDLFSNMRELENKVNQQSNFIKIMQHVIEEADTTSMDPELAKEVKNNKIVRATVNKSDEDPSAPLPVQQSLEEPSGLAFFYPTTPLPYGSVVTAHFSVETGHYGVDIVAPYESPVKAIEGGVIVLSTWVPDAGWMVIIQHHTHYISVYKHNAVVFRKVGQKVDQGEVIALLGNSGHLSAGSHLHFELWQQGNPVNPEDFINLSS